MMDGEIFAENKDGCFNVTVVLKKSVAEAALFII